MRPATKPNVVCTTREVVGAQMWNVDDGDRQVMMLFLQVIWDRENEVSWLPLSMFTTDGASLRASPRANPDATPRASSESWPEAFDVASDLLLKANFYHHSSGGVPWTALDMIKHLAQDPVNNRFIAVFDASNPSHPTEFRPRYPPDDAIIASMPAGVTMYEAIAAGLAELGVMTAKFDSASVALRQHLEREALAHGSRGATIEQQWRVVAGIPLLPMTAAQDVSWLTSLFKVMFRFGQEEHAVDTDDPDEMVLAADALNSVAAGAGRRGSARGRGRGGRSSGRRGGASGRGRGAGRNAQHTE